MGPPMHDPLVIVLPSRVTPGAGSTDDLSRLQAFEPQPLSRALATAYATDAHFALYSFPLDRWPRINKEFLPELERLGSPPTVAVTALDWDRPDHAGRVTPEEVQRVESLIPANLRPSYLYPTRAGVRLLYTHAPLPPCDAEALHVGLADLLAASGLHCDRAVWDWTRIHRLPHVLRDGERSQVTVTAGPPLDHSAVPRGQPPQRALNTRTLRLDRPPEDRAYALCWRPSSNGRGVVATDWTKEAKRRLVGRNGNVAELEPFLVPDNAPPIPGSRNETLMGWLGCMSAILIRQPGTTPAHVYGLLIPALNATPPPAGRNLHDEAWKELCYCWARDEVKLELEAEAAAQAKVETENTAERILSTMRTDWPAPPAIPPDALDALCWLERHAVVSAGNSYYVLGPDGWYGDTPVSRLHLVSALRDAGLGGIVELRVPRAKGDGDREITPQEILNRYHTALGPRPESGFGKGTGYFNEKTKTLHLCSYFRRTDIPPAFHPDVDKWLRLFFGNSYEFACQWIGLALAYDRGPICALSVCGPKGVGKSMLARGLAECITTECFVTSSVFGAWQADLNRTPFIVIDEGWPSSTAKDVADTFRTLVAGDGMTANDKYAPLVRIRTNPRVLLTANNQRLFHGLFTHKQLDHDDQDAVAQRVHHLVVDDAASKWLESRGGRAFTAGWVKGDIESRYTIAKHFLWLYQQHGQRNGAGRFLLSGRTDPHLLWQASVNNNSALEVGYAIAKLANRHKERIAKTGELWFTAREATRCYEDETERPFPGGAIAFGQKVSAFCVRATRKNDNRRMADLTRLAKFMEEQDIPREWDLAETSI